jgi:hypothetical protein
LFHLLPPSGANFDLVINTLSMSEMSEHQVRTYASGISKMIGNNGVFFEQNHDNRPHGMLDAKQVLRDYFRENMRIVPSTPTVHGVANLWANRKLDFE